MNRRAWCVGLLAAVMPLATSAQDDPGKEALGAVIVRVFHGTDGDPSVAGADTKDVPEEVARRLRGEARLKFAHYRELGSDTKALYRSYENWAQPLGASDEVLVRFEAHSRPVGAMAHLGLELWLSRRKVLKTDADIAADRPLYVLGPVWRGGRMIISVELAPPSRNPS